jgi:hypothetical protein
LQISIAEGSLKGNDGQKLISYSSLSATIKFSSLFAKKVDISELKLQDPQITLASSKIPLQIKNEADKEQAFVIHQVNLTDGNIKYLNKSEVYDSITFKKATLDLDQSTLKAEIYSNGIATSLFVATNLVNFPDFSLKEKGQFSYQILMSKVNGLDSYTSIGTATLEGDLILRNNAPPYIKARFEGQGLKEESFILLSRVYSALLPSGSDWSNLNVGINKQISLDILKNIRADVDISLSDLRIKSALLGNIHGLTQIGDKKLITNFALNHYEGNADGQFYINNESNNPHYQLRLSLKDMHLDKIFNEDSSMKVNGGKLNAELNIATSETSTISKIVWYGVGQVAIADVSVKFPSEITLLLSHMLKKDFSENKNNFQFKKISSNFSLVNNNLINNDIIIEADDFSFKGNGHTDFDTNQIDYTLVLDHISRSLYEGATVKMLINGALDSPEYKLDMSDYIQLLLKKYDAQN